jgi:hypothetical protein
MPRLSSPNTLFGRRLREARLKMGIAQDKLGVLIGIDEQTCQSASNSYQETASKSEQLIRPISPVSCAV